MECSIGILVKFDMNKKKRKKELGIFEYLLI